MLNAGYESGAVVRRMGGGRMTTVEAFPVFSPKAFAGIGELPDTIRDRAIRIRLERRIREETIERFIRRTAPGAAIPLRKSAELLARLHLVALTNARPDLPDVLDDRAQDMWEPLLAIADRAGGDWPRHARHAAVTLSSGDAREDQSLSAGLLGDIHTIFVTGGPQRYLTADLITELSKVEESPWGDWHGKPITAQTLSRLLRPYGIRTMSVKVEGKTVRGYKAEQFADAFRRVLGVTGVTGDTVLSPTDAERNASNAGNGRHAVVSVPLPGDDGYLDRVAAAHRDGHITTGEALELEWVHRFVLAEASAA